MLTDFAANRQTVGRWNVDQYVSEVQNRNAVRIYMQLDRLQKRRCEFLCSTAGPVSLALHDVRRNITNDAENIGKNECTRSALRTTSCSDSRRELRRGRLGDSDKLLA